MTVSADDEAALASKFAVMRQVLDERRWRLYLGTEAGALGYGGIAAVARAAGASEATVAAGAREAADGEALAALEPGRSRRPGAGRPRAGDAQPGLGKALGEVLEAGRRGDPMKAVTWNMKFWSDIAEPRLCVFGGRALVTATTVRTGLPVLGGGSRWQLGRSPKSNWSSCARFLTSAGTT